MDVLSKLKNTVSTTVSQLSGVLPGNLVTREFEATRHIASAGPGLLWKIYEGHKKSTKQEAAIFVLEKKVLEKYSRRERDLILESLRRGVAQITRLRHPKILTVQHPLEESRESLAFATEPVFASLANVIGNHDNMPSPLPNDIKDYQLFEVEIKYGILQICEALTFLHGDVKLLHRNISPESIIINKSGSWKLSGFEFYVPCNSPPGLPVSWTFYEWEADVHPQAQPPLAYLAPEYALTLSCDASSDMYSLGSLIYSVFNRGKTLLGNGNTYSAFKKHACEMKSLSLTQLGGIPSEARDHVKLLLNVTPELRPDSHQFSKIPFFEDVGAKTLEYLDSLFQWDNLQKSQFYKGLPQVITKMPKRVNLYRIIPCLAKEYVNAEMVPFVLPSVLLIAEDSTKEEFCKNILPELRPIFKLQEPVQILLIFMQKMELLLSKTPTDDIKLSVLPMVYRALESDTFQIQELCLNIIPNFANLVDYPSMKNALLPRIKKLCLTTQYISVRVNCLVCLGKLLEHLDKWLVLDDILPMLPEIPSREPAVLMGILGIYKLALTHKKLGITKDVMATKVIPFIMPLSIESGLNLSQFNAIIAVVKDMVNRVEIDHRAKLEQLNSMQQEQRSSLEMSKVHMPNKSELISGIDNKPLSDTDQMFKGLGLGSYVEERDVTKTAAEFLPASTNSSNKPATSSEFKPAVASLSLEDKEILAREQDRHRTVFTSTLEMSKILMLKKNELTSDMENESLSDSDERFEGRDVTKTVPKFVRTSMNSSSNPAAYSGFKPVVAVLSLEDKARLARGQERHQQLRKLTPLQPAQGMVQPPPRPANGKDGPRNLTDTLISSNLANMSSGQTRATYTPNYNPNIAGFSPGPNLSTPGMQQSPNYAIGSQTAFQSPHGTFYPNGMAAPNSGWMLSNSNLTANSSSTIPASQSIQQPNLSSFDSLLSSTSSKLKVSMNQMVGQRQPIVFPFQSNPIQNTMTPQRFPSHGMTPTSLNPTPTLTGLTSPPSTSNASMDLSDLLG